MSWGAAFFNSSGEICGLKAHRSGVHVVNEEKSRTVDLDKGESFGFLGFEFRRVRARSGQRMPLRTPSVKKRTELLRKRGFPLRAQVGMHHNPYEVAKWLGKILNGWLRYYAVPTSSPSLRRFAFRLRRMWLRVLRRRSQTDRTKLDKLGRVAAAFWPPLQILHPWPEQRFAVKHPR